MLSALPIYDMHITIQTYIIHCMHIYIYIYTHTYIHTQLYISTYTYTHLYMSSKVASQSSPVPSILPEVLLLTSVRT